MEQEKLCQTYLLAAAEKVRSAGLARGVLRDDSGRVCMLGAMMYCGVHCDISKERIYEHIVSILPPRPEGSAGGDDFNSEVEEYPQRSPSFHIAWWSNMRAKDAEEVARMFEVAALTC